MSNKIYINNKEFEKQVLIYQKDKSNEDLLVTIFDTLINNILRAYHFKIDEEDAKQECFILIFKNIYKFDPANRGSI